MELSKKCSKCDQNKSICEFYKNENICKACRRITRRAYLTRNKEAIARKRKAYRVANKEKIAAYKKAYYLAHKSTLSKRRTDLNERESSTELKDLRGSWELLLRRHLW